MPETDYTTWYTSSQSYQDPKQSAVLKQVLETKQSQGSFTILKQGLTEEYHLKEQYYPSVLKIRDDQVSDFTKLVDERFPNLPEANPLDKEDETTLLGKNHTFSIVHFIRWLSAENMIWHAARFSFVSFILLQIILLPGNLSTYKPGDWGIALFFGVLVTFCYFAILSYAKLYKKIRQYRDIFKITASYCSSLFLFIFLEILIIDLFNPDFILLFSLLLIFLGQLAAMIISLFLSALLYLISGGKLINMPNEPPQ